jgi:hypothetical protein
MITRTDLACRDFRLLRRDDARATWEMFFLSQIGFAADEENRDVGSTSVARFSVPLLIGSGVSQRAGDNLN